MFESSELQFLLLLLVWFRDFRRRVTGPSHQVLKYWPYFYKNNNHRTVDMCRPSFQMKAVYISEQGVRFTIYHANYIVNVS